MPIKILHLIPTLASGGAERLLVDVISNTSKEDFEHIVCVINKADFFASQLHRNGFKIIPLNEFEKHPFLSSSWKLRKIINRYKPDIIQSWLYDANIVARLAKIGKREISLITSIHSPDYDAETIKAGNSSSYKVEVLRIIDKITARMTKPHFVCCSQFVADSYQKKLGVNPSDISVIYNLVNPKNLSCKADEPNLIRQTLDIPEDGFIYINVGRLDLPKGQAYLLKAFQKVLLQIPQAFLVLIGAGPSETDYKELAKSLKIDHRVRFLGRKKGIGAYLEMADVFVFPTLFEGFGIALVEAMTKRLPCVATRLDVIEEIIDDKVSGLLIAPRSESEIAEAMIRLYKDPELRISLGQQAFQKAENQFFSNVIIPKWNKLYLDVLLRDG